MPKETIDLSDAPQPAYRKPEPTISRVTDDMKKIRDSIDELYQIVHNRGLEAGMPAMIRHNVVKTLGILNKVELVWKADDKRCCLDRKNKSFEHVVSIRQNDALSVLGRV